MKRILTLIIFFCLVSSVFARDDSTKPIGLKNFDIKTIGLNGRLEDMRLVDLNRDGLDDCLLVYVKKGAVPVRYLAVLFQKPTGFSRKVDQAWVAATEATVLVVGDYHPAAGIEIGYLTGREFKCYTLANTGPVPAFDPVPKKIADMPSLLKYPQADSLPLSSYSVDLDNNGWPDLIVPQLTGYRIYFQSRQDSTVQWADCLIPLTNRTEAEEKNSSFVTLTRTLPNFQVVDFNADHLKDLIIFRNATLFYYLQQAAEPAKRFTPQPNGRFQLKFLQKELKANELATAEAIFTDIDDNDLSDLVIFSLRGKLEDLSKLTTRIFIWRTPLIRIGDSYPILSETPHQIINLKGICPSLRLTDVNGDGFQDLVTSSFRTDMKSNLQKVLLRYVKLNYQVYLFQPGKNKFPRTADYDRNMNFPMSLVGRGKKYFSHIYLKDDLNNDGRIDLLRVSGPHKKRGVLTINKGYPAEKLRNKNGIGFEKDEYLRYPVRIPQRVLVEDLNRDKKKDIILVYRSRLIILMSK